MELDEFKKKINELKNSEPAEEAWLLLWDYIANEDADEDYSADMAEKLCEVVLPKVWSCIAQLEEDRDALVRCFEEASRRIATGKTKRLDFKCSHCGKDTPLSIDGLLDATRKEIEDAG